MVIDLTPWLDLENWVYNPKAKGVEVIDKCIFSNTTMTTPEVATHDILDHSYWSVTARLSVNISQYP